MRSRIHLIRFSLLFTVSILVVGPAGAAETSDLAARVDAVFADYAKPGSPGCALAVIKDGSIAYEKGYGLASVELGVPITPKTVFDIGSTSKQFTAASILLLAQDGKLSLDDDIHKYVPELPDYGVPVTIRHLLHHTSGMRDYINVMFLGGINVEDWTTDADALAALVRQKTLDFKPGEEHSYSNSGYFLLSIIVKRVSGKSLKDFAQERIFTPLGMTTTHYLNDHMEVVPGRASSYEPRPDGGFAVQSANWEQTGDGAVQTTVEDLAKWDQNFYTPKVGGTWLIEQLQTTGTLNNGEKITYARGLAVEEYRGLRRVSHGGAWAGYRAQLMRFPVEKLAVVTLCNLGSADTTGLAQGVANLYLGDRLAPEAAVAASETAPAAAGAVDVARLAGLYWSPASDFVRKIYGKEGKLFYYRGPESESELAPLADARFLMLGVPPGLRAEVSFPQGTPRRMLVSTNGGTPMVFEEVQPVEPKPEELAAYAGTYTSVELDTTWTLAVESDGLVMRGKRGPARPLRAAFTDAFGSDFGLLRFTRDGEKKINGFLIGAGRARNLKFERQ
ncbi:MAG TPA: serine hydrolase domain-containing protein [Thermoanaerobaculia bacterium]|jgi:CubicO group peptidase (beta-lactamase class C family)|nr:serine hydrolase domain-containing protein [Thermoanaerobaculia bacterium]